MSGTCQHTSTRTETTVTSANREPGSATVRVICNDCGATL